MFIRLSIGAAIDHINEHGNGSEEEKRIVTNLELSMDSLDSIDAEFKQLEREAREAVAFSENAYDAMRLNT